MSTILQLKCRRVRSAGNCLTKNLNFESISKEQRKCRSANANANTNVHSIDEQIIVEDLDENRETLQQQKPKLESEESTNNLCNHLFDDEDSGQGDYTVYQGGDLNDFFGESIPQRVSEVCLVNDHYILVKMPETCWRRNSQMDCIIEEVTEEKSVQASKSVGGSKISKYFQCNRSRRVSPIHEEMTGQAISNKTKTTNTTNTVKGCWSATGEKEVFETQTKIKHSLGAIEKFQQPEQNENKMAKSQESQEDNKNLNVRIKEEAKEKLECSPNLASSSKSVSFEAPQTEDDNSNIKLKSSLHHMVHLEHYGSIETSTVTSKFQSTCDSQKKAKPRRHFNAFSWFLKKFRMRNSKAKEPKSKIHAIIYKTYFVRWKKPPDELWHGYGKRRQSDDLPELRRCRSAIF